jgi:hypothetical protein
VIRFLAIIFLPWSPASSPAPLPRSRSSPTICGCGARRLLLCCGSQAPKGIPHAASEPRAGIVPQTVGITLRRIKALAGRGSRIRTCDLEYPKLPRYQTALYPAKVHGRETPMRAISSHRYTLLPTAATCSGATLETFCRTPAVPIRRPANQCEARKCVPPSSRTLRRHHALAWRWPAPAPAAEQDRHKRLQLSGSRAKGSDGFPGNYRYVALIFQQSEDGSLGGLQRADNSMPHIGFDSTAQYTHGGYIIYIGSLYYFR